MAIRIDTDRDGGNKVSSDRTAAKVQQTVVWWTSGNGYDDMETGECVLASRQCSAAEPESDFTSPLIHTTTTTAQVLTNVATA
jgi:hypothetical protein